jgi:hypothetical protein
MEAWQIYAHAALRPGREVRYLLRRRMSGPTFWKFRRIGNLCHSWDSNFGFSSPYPSLCTNYDTPTQGSSCTCVEGWVGPQSGSLGEEKIVVNVGIRTLDFPARIPVCISTTIPRLKVQVVNRTKVYWFCIKKYEFAVDTTLMELRIIFSLRSTIWVRLFVPLFITCRYTGHLGPCPPVKRSGRGSRNSPHPVPTFPCLQGTLQGKLRLTSITCTFAATWFARLIAMFLTSLTN